MKNKKIYETLLLSFLVALIVETFSFLREQFFSLAKFIDSSGIYLMWIWLFLLLICWGLFSILASKSLHLFKIEDEESKKLFFRIGCGLIIIGIFCLSILFLNIVFVGSRLYPSLHY